MDKAPTAVLWDNDAYGASPVNIHPPGNDLFIISDLHLAAGLNICNNYEGTENFFADHSFVRFLDHLQNNCVNSTAVLVINGDFIDFVRITTLPISDEDFTTWQNILVPVGVNKTIEELKDSVSKKEKTYGLKTHDYKSVWKLHVCILGHYKLFERLAKWLMDGNELMITKGNHDLEWYWKEVRRYLQYWFANDIAQRTGVPVAEVITKTIVPKILLADDAIIIDNKIHIEHGHRFENTTNVKGEPLIDNKLELNLPFGSFFNRYLINRVELLYPYLDNVRPTQNILLVLFRERFPFAIVMLFRYLLLMWLLIRKRIFWQTLKYLITFLLIVVLPIAITAFAIFHDWSSTQESNGKKSFASEQALSIVKNLGFLFLSYLFARIMALVKLKSPHSFYPDAQEIFYKNPDISIVTFGHTHNPEQVNNLTSWYFNTGTWIPIYESSSTEVRMDRTFTFLHINRNDKGEFKPAPLQRWNDDALRADDLLLNERK
jgi:UDP-2,3-diacylglucosamine pyrophosphatase LpxH